MAHPYKGIPRKDWPKKGETLPQQEPSGPAAPLPVAAVAPTLIPPNPFAAQVPEGLNLPLEPQVSRETSVPPVVNSDSAGPQSLPRNLFSGNMKSLDVYGHNGSTLDPIPGFGLYWFEDRDGTGLRLNQAKLSGWEFVTNDEVALTDELGRENSDLGSRVRKPANKNATPPTFCYLMKKPKWMIEAHRAEQDKLHMRIEDALRSGRLNRDPANRQFAAGEVPNSSLPKIEIKHTLNR